MLTGLCDSCIYKKWIENERGSPFLLCELSKKDPRFRKYPTLPVFRCDGYAESNEKDASTFSQEEEDQ
jgi:hypothetical protein